jgi:hypothetical protein
MLKIKELIPATWLFRFVVPVHYHPDAGKQGLPEWLDQHELPHLGSMAGRPSFSRVWAAWSERGLSLAFAVRRQQQDRRRAKKLGAKDYVEIYFNTRPGTQARRVNRYCQAFRILPVVTPPQKKSDMIQPLRLAVEYFNPRTAEHVRVVTTFDGCDYALCVILPAKALPGFEPDHEPRLGFMYAVFDESRGVQTFTGTDPYLMNRDPSLWVPLELTRQELTGP